MKGKLLAVDEASTERPTIDGSRNSTLSDTEPAREPQPLSPQDTGSWVAAIEEGFSELSSTDTPTLESPGGASSSFARPSASGPEHEEGLVTEADSSLNSSPSEEASGNIIDDDADVDYSYVRAGEDGMPRHETMLQYIEQTTMRSELQIVVPEGMGKERKVTFTYENKSHEVEVPEGYEVGQQVLITLSHRPFLERTTSQGARRGHLAPEFADKWSITDSLRHSLRTDADHSTLQAEEFRQRYACYGLLRGKAGTPLLPFTEEETASQVHLETWTHA
jgi:hypothetical protein